MGTTASEVRELYGRLDELDRRLAASQITGDVAAVSGKRVRIKLLDCPVLGKPMLSPWVQVQEQAGGGAGGMSSAAPIRVGETMRLLSPSGEIGPASLAIRDGYTDQSPRPTDRDDEYVIAIGDQGQAKLRMREGRVSLEREEQIVEFDKEAGRIRVHHDSRALTVIRESSVQMKARPGKAGEAPLHVTLDLNLGTITSSVPIEIAPDPHPED